MESVRVQVRRAGQVRLHDRSKVAAEELAGVPVENEFFTSKKGKLFFFPSEKVIPVRCHLSPVDLDLHPAWRAVLVLVDLLKDGGAAGVVQGVPVLQRRPHRDGGLFVSIL